MLAVQSINLDHKNKLSADYASNNAVNPESALIKFRSSIKLAQTSTGLFKNDDGSLEWWEILLIVIACIWFCACVIWLIVFCCLGALAIGAAKEA